MVAGILLRKFPQSMPQPKDAYWKNLSKKYCNAYCVATTLNIIKSGS